MRTRESAHFARPPKTRNAGGSIGKLRVIGYGSGDFAFNLSFTFSSLFLLYFYTDVLELGGTTAGLIMLVALVWEGVTDPLAGLIANRTSSRWGRYRPYLLLGALPLAASFSLMFLPLGLSGVALVAYVALTHVAYRTVFTFVNVPYVALSAQMTSDSLVRGELAASRMIFAVFCGIALSAFTLPMAKILGGGAEGFFRLSLIYSVVATAILIFCFAITNESQSATEPAPPGVGEMISSMCRNRALLILLPGTILGAVAYTMSNKALVYYMKYVVGSEGAVTKGLLATLTAAAAAMIPWLLVTKKTSKRTVWLSGAVITSTALLAIYVLEPTAGPLLWILLALTGIGNAAFILTFWSMLPDTIELGEWITGTRAEGAIMGLTLFTQKIALGVGTGLIGILLDLIGYVPNRPQAPGARQGILVMYTIVPSALFLGAAAIIAFYPLDRHTHERIVRVLHRRRIRTAW